MQIPGLSVVLMAALFAAVSAQAASLEVSVSHLRPTRTVTVSVFKDAEAWAHHGSPTTTRQFKVVGVQQTLRIDDLPSGRYAVRVDQEPNDSSLEPWSFPLYRHGFSGTSSSDRQPTFDQAAIEVGDGDTPLRIHLFTSDTR